MPPILIALIFISSLSLDDLQLREALHNILVHPAQPLLLKMRLSAGALDGLLQVLTHKGNKVNAMYGVRVYELALADVFGGFRFVGFGERLGRPVEAAAAVLVSATIGEEKTRKGRKLCGAKMCALRGRENILGALIIHTLQKLTKNLRPHNH